MSDRQPPELVKSLEKILDRTDDIPDYEFHTNFIKRLKWAAHITSTCTETDCKDCLFHDDADDEEFAKWFAEHFNL